MALKLKGSTSGFVAIDAPSVAGNNTLILPENTGSAQQLLGNDITAGVVTFTSVTVNRNGDLTVPGTISIGGTLTYEDVTSVDSVGIVTARGLSIFGNTTGLSVSGIATITKGASGGATANSDAALIIDNSSHAYIQIRTPNDKGQGILFGDAADNDAGSVAYNHNNNSLALTVNANEAVRITSNGNFGVATGTPAQKFHVYGNSGTTAIALGDNSTTQPYMLLEARETQNLCTVHSRTNNPLTFEINQNEYMRIKQDGHVGIGTDDPGQDLTIFADGPNFRMTHTGNTNQKNSAYVHVDETGMELNSYQEVTATRRPIIFKQYTDERARIDGGGRLLIGTTSHTGHALSGTNNSKVQLESASSADYGRMSLIYNGNDGVGPGFWFGKSRGTSIGSNTIVQDGDQCGGFFFHAADGTDKNSRAASIVCQIDGTPGANDTPGELVFATTADGSSGTTNRMRIDSVGNTHFGTSGTLNGSNTVSIVPADGLINFGMDGRSSFVTSTNSAYIYSGEGSSGTTLAGDLILQSRSNQNRTIRFVTGSTPTQRARINEYGLYVDGTITGKAVSASSAKAGSFDPYVFDVNGAQQSTETVSIKSQKNDCLDLTRYYTAGTIQTFRFNNDFTGRIETGTTSVTYHTSSDYRLKENAVAISDGITRLKQLKPYKFNFIKEPSVIHDGFFAHEVTPVVPTAVSGEKDATETRYYETGDVLPEGKEVGDVKEENAVLPQSLDHSKLVPLLTAALKEAITKIETLETKVAALEGS